MCFQNMITPTCFDPQEPHRELQAFCWSLNDVCHHNSCVRERERDKERDKQEEGEIQGRKGRE